MRCGFLLLGLASSLDFFDGITGWTGFDEDWFQPLETAGLAVLMVGTFQLLRIRKIESYAPG